MDPAAQIVSSVRTGDAYAWTGHGNGTTAYVSNGLNQQISIGGSAANWDSKGNLTGEPQSAKTYGYSSENLLTSASGGVTIAYDPAMRLQQITAAATTKFAYDGLDTIAEYDDAGTMLARYVFGPGIDQPLERYDGSGTSNKVSLHADERGSIVALTYGSPYAPTINRYDEYGRPQSGNVGRFQYTGQMWMSEAGLYHYKARAYFPGLGIFAQTDPIRYAGSPNLYAYVVNDPVNLADPLGLQDSNGEDNNGDDKNQPVDCGGPGIIICANRGSADPASSPAADYLGLGYGFASNEAEILANLAQNTVTVKLPPARPARPTPKPPKPPAPPTPKPPKTISQCEAYSKLGTGLGYAGIMNGAAGVALSATGVGAPVGAILNGIGLVEGLAGGALVVYGDIFCEAG